MADIAEIMDMIDWHMPSEFESKEYHWQGTRKQSFRLYNR